MRIVATAALQQNAHTSERYGRGRGPQAGQVHAPSTYLALLVMLEEVLRGGAARVRAVGVLALQDVLPELLAELALLLELALVACLPALSAVPQEQKPPLLLLHILRPHLIRHIGRDGVWCTS